MHLTILWFVVILVRVVPDVLEIQQNRIILLRDGMPLTARQYFADAQHDLWKVALFLFLCELCYVFIFKKVRLPVFMLCCLFAGVLTWIPVDLLRPSQIHLGVVEASPAVLSMAAYGFIYTVVRDYFENRGRRKALRLQQSEHELHVLKAQLNPHFLFNSLNYLYGTALRENAADTAEGVDRLSQMMRYTISGMHENKVPLAKEINFVQHYIALQKVRMPNAEDILFDLDLNLGTMNLQIAPLLLLPFLENAFTYGISVDHPVEIQIGIKLVGSVLDFSVSNRIFMKRPEVEGNQTGLKNTIKRLALLYPGQYSYNFSNTGEQYRMTLALNLKPF